MKKISKKILSKELNKELNLNLYESNLFVNKFFQLLKNNSNKKNIKLHNFGTFYKKKTPERIGRNPKTLEEFKIKQSIRLSFKPSNSVKKNIN